MTISTLAPTLSAKEVGLIIGRHEKTVLGLARRKVIGCIRPPTGSVRFTAEHVMDYLDKFTVDAEPEFVPEAEVMPDRNPKYTNK